MLLIGMGVNAQFTSNAVTGGYHEASSWSGTVPPANGVLSNSIRISTGAVITRSDQGSGNSIDARGSDLWGYSSLIEGKFIIEGSVINNSGGGLRVFNGGTLEIYGDLSADEEVTVDNGGTLIVHGNLYLEDAGWGYQHNLFGTVIVKGNAELADFVFNNTGMLVVGGDLTLDGNRWTRIVNGSDVYVDGTITDHNGNGTFDNSSDEGDFTDLENEQGGNDVLNDILKDMGLISNVDKPTDFTYSNLTTNTVDLSWTANANGDGVIITTATTNSLVKPVKGTTYREGDVIDGATVVYIGSASPQTGVPITPAQDNYISIWSVHGAGGSTEYSVASTILVEVLSSSTIFYEDFENISQANSDWTRGSSGSIRWYVGSAERYMGNNAAYVTNKADGSVASYDNERGPRAIHFEQDIDLSDPKYASYKSAELTFYWKSVAEPNYDGGSVRENNTYLSGQVELAGQDTWEEKVIDITNYLGTTFDLRFRWYNDQHAGQDVPLCIDEIRITGSEVARPQTFSSSAYSSSQVDLSWTKSADNDDVIIAYSPFGSIGRPKGGIAYEPGDLLDGGGVVVYVGSNPSNSYVHNGNFSGTLNYTIWSVKNNAYSSSLTSKVRIPVSLPFNEDFEGDVDVWNFNVGYENAWVHGAATSNGGTYSAYISDDKGVTAGYDRNFSSDTRLELAIDLRGFESATMTFNWKLQGGNNAYGEVMVDGTRTTSTEGRAVYRYQPSWNEETIDLSTQVGALRTIGFRWDNWDSGSNPGFCVDDISIIGILKDPQVFRATNSNDLYNDLSWTKNTYGDDVIIAVSENGVVGTLDPDEEYAVGDALTGGGTIVYVGSGMTYKHEPLKYSTTYTYKIWSARNGSYSAGIERSAGTPDKVTVLFEDWEGSSGLTWSGTLTGENYWRLEGTGTYSGTSGHSTYITRRDNGATYNKGVSHTASLQYTSLDLKDLQSATLKFDWKCVGESTFDYGEVRINGVKIPGSREFSGQSGWVTESIDLIDYCGTAGDQILEFYWTNDNSGGSNPGFCIDNIEIGGIYIATSSVAQGSDAEPSEISSLIDTQAEALQVFDIEFIDGNSQNHLLAPPEIRTLIQQFVISKGAANTVADWSDAIAGALLFGPDVDVNGLAGTVSNSGITFSTSGSNIIIDNTSSETYHVKIWLNTDLNAAGIKDGDVFDFKLNNNEIVTGWGDDFKVDESIESGAIPIQVIATDIKFTQQPSSNASVDAVLGQAAEVSAVDPNGNVDKDYATTITLTNSGAIAMTNSALMPVDGIASFSSLTFKGIGTVTLTATSGSLSSEESNNIKISNYCVPSMNSSDRYITNVIVDNINNATGDDGGYAEFLDQETSFAKGKTYDITVGIQNNSNIKTAYVVVWVDWNGDGNYNETGISIGDTDLTGVRAISGSIPVPSDAISGTTRMRVRFSQRSSKTNPCRDSDGEIEEYTIIIANEGWLGQNTNWNVSSNWSTGTVPTLLTDVFIPEHPQYNDVYPVINGSASMNALEIANNASLTIESGSLVDINGDIIINGDLIIENTTAQPASVITNSANTITGDVSVRWTYDELHWWFTGHSISNPVMSTYTNIPINDNTNKYALYEYSDAGRLVRTSGLNTDALSGERIRGYQFKTIKPVTLEHVGKLNNEPAYSKALLDGWQIIANPYPAYYQLPEVADNTGDFGSTEGTVYVSNSATNASKYFDTYNVFAGIATPRSFDGVIAPNQAFYIKTKDSEYGSGKLISMDASNRTNSGSKPTLKSGNNGNNGKNVLRLHLKNEHNLTDEAVIALFPDGEKGITQRDSEQRMYTGTNYSYIYSLVEDTKLVINVLPDELVNYKQQLGVETKKGKQYLKITGVEALKVDYQILLEDKLEESLITMNSSVTYEFDTEEGVDHERFVLHFKAKGIDVPTDIDDVEREDQSVKVYVQNHSTLNVSCEWDNKKKTIEVYTVSGSLIMNQEFEGNSFKHELRVQPGVYIVKVSNVNHSYQQKVFVK